MNKFAVLLTAVALLATPAAAVDLGLATLTSQSGATSTAGSTSNGGSVAGRPQPTMASGDELIRNIMVAHDAMPITTAVA